MAMMTIFFTTLAIISSFTPLVGVLEAQIVGFIFIIAIHISLMISMAVIFLLFGITASSTKVEKRMLQISNLRLRISFLTLAIAYITSI